MATAEQVKVRRIVVWAATVVVGVYAAVVLYNPLEHSMIEILATIVAFSVLVPVAIRHRRKPAKPAVRAAGWPPPKG